MEVAEGYKDTKIGRIPKDWELIKIQKLIDKKYIIGHLDGNHGELYPKANEFSQNGKGVPYVGANSFIAGKVDFSKCKRLPLERALKFKKGIAENGDILFAHNATVGPVAMLEIQRDFVILSTTATYYRLDEQQINSSYWFQFLNSSLFIKQYQRVMGQSTRNQVPITQQRKFFAVLPPLPEQQKIAEILSTVDEQISTTQAIIDKSKELKKGLMQKLFSEGIGHTEFKDTKIGRIPKGWEVVKLNEVGLIKVGRDLNKKIYSPTLSKEHKVPVYSNAISCRGLYGFYSTSEYPKNSITITGRGDIGYAFARNEEFGAIGRLIVIQPNSNIDYVFLTNYINHCVNFHIETSGIPQLTGVQASAYKVAIPSLKEQQKIAEILSEADAKIEKEENEKAKLEELKKGLMQQLLTGNKRVKV
jgi:type I restriction enzyme S subunit